jgi:tetratricopeptide (TPR) repeat protein
MSRLGTLGIALGAILASGVPALGQNADLAVVRARALAREGRCDEALALLAQSGAASARASLLRGQCHLEGRRYAEAVAALDEALRIDPSLDAAKLPLLIARYEVGDLAGARELVDEIPPESAQRAEFHLYRGLLLLDEAQAAEAGLAFDRARELSPSGVDPAASYYGGVAWLAAKQRERADAAFARVIATAPGSEWAREAERARAGATPVPRAALTRWGTVQIGAEWDSNVVLRGEGVALPSDISDEADGRAVWMLDGGAELFRTALWSGGLTASYRGSAHFDLSEFDEHHPIGGFWLDRRVGEDTVARLRGDVGFAWIDGADFLSHQEIFPELIHDFGSAGTTSAGVHFYRQNFLYAPYDDIPSPPGPPGIDESSYRNRDGWGLAAEVDHSVLVGAHNTELSFGARYHWYDARGGEYAYQGPELWAGVEAMLPFELVGRASVGYAFLPFDHFSSFDPGYPNTPDREDQVWRVRLELERAIAAGFSVLARYGYADRISNVDVFDYDRHIVGLYVSYGFAR